MPKALQSNSFLLKNGILLLVMIGLAMTFNLFQFQGLSSRFGIDQAQTAREVARGNGFTTKLVRPLAVQQRIDSGLTIDLNALPDTYNAPLGILVYAAVLKASGADDPSSYRMAKDDTIYVPDRIIAITCTVFFLLAIILNHLLIHSIFDHKIAFIVTLVTLLSKPMWDLTQTGLPTMLMLLLFTTASYLIHLAIARKEADGSPLLFVFLAGFFLSLLVLTNWLTLWIYIGFILFAAFYFNPKGIIAAGLIILISLVIATPLIYYQSQSGNPAGTALYTLHSGDVSSELYYMRGLNSPYLNLKLLYVRVAQSFASQFTNIHLYLGGIVIAPLFFLALFHPFRKRSIANFRWAVFIMWVFAAMGMSLYDGGSYINSPNQLHTLFMPLMTAYAFAMLSIVWSRSKASQMNGFFAHSHFIIITVICALPLFTYFFNIVKAGGETQHPLGANPLSLNYVIHQAIPEDAIIASDAPWHTAWYADRTSVWMPSNSQQLSVINSIASGQGSPIFGLYFSAESIAKSNFPNTIQIYSDFSPLATGPMMRYITGLPVNPALLSRSDTPLSEATKELIAEDIGEYPNMQYLSSSSVLYTREAVDFSVID